MNYRFFRHIMRTFFSNSFTLQSLCYIIVWDKVDWLATTHRKNVPRPGWIQNKTWVLNAGKHGDIRKCAFFFFSRILIKIYFFCRTLQRYRWFLVKNEAIIISNRTFNTLFFGFFEEREKCGPGFGSFTKTFLVPQWFLHQKSSASADLYHVFNLA